MTPKPAAPIKRRKPQPHRGSPLEALPNEILQEIYLLSLNLDLQLCSKTIARKLASDHVYEELAFRVLISTPEECLRWLSPVRLRNPARLVGDEKLLHLQIEHVRAMQSRLIQSPRFNIDVLKRLDQRLEVRLRALLTDDQLTFAKNEISYSLHYTHPRADEVPDYTLDNFEGSTEACAELRDCWAFAYFWRTTEEVFWRMKHTGAWNWKALEPDADHLCRIPYRLLEGPWSERQVGLLRYFVCITNCLYDSNTRTYASYTKCSEVRRSVSKGLGVAVTAGDESAFEALLSLAARNPEFYKREDLLPPLFVEVIRKQSHRRDLMWDMIWYSIESVERVMASQGLPTTGESFQFLLTREVWTWLDQNYRHNPDAIWLKQAMAKVHEELEICSEFGGGDE